MGSERRGAVTKRGGQRKISEPGIENILTPKQLNSSISLLSTCRLADSEHAR